MNTVSKALIIDDPWFELILNGKKTWEMRSTSASFRGWFGLIRKGTGAVWGVARLVDSLPPLSPQEMIANCDKHLIPEHMIRSGQVAKWTTPWVLSDVKPFKFPIHYKHKSGAVIWVELDLEVSEAIARQFKPLREAPMPAIEPPKPELRPFKPTSPKPNPRVSPVLPPARNGKGVLLGQTQLTEGNIKNNHIYLRKFFHKFPADAIGGSNGCESAPRSIEIEFGDPNPIRTDLDGKKKFFRARGWVRRLFEMTGAEVGDWVLVEEIEPYRYRVGLHKSIS
jgi:hypothetical protein